MPDLELVLWVILPLMLAVGLTLMSLNSLRQGRSAVQFCLGLPVLLMMTGAIKTLIKMLEPMTWPSFLPHVVLVISLPLVLWQHRLAKSHRQQSDSG
jgi:hypothetical protein